MTNIQTKLRPCPKCGNAVESDAVKVKSLKTYICGTCKTKLWLIQGTLLDKLIVAEDA